jgi:putative flippase GtrA
MTRRAYRLPGGLRSGSGSQPRPDHTGPVAPVQSLHVSVAEPVRLRLGTTWRLLLKELSAFGVVGIACFAIDILLFQVLYAHAHLGAVTAKCLATVVSTTVAYFAHRYWSFSHRARTGLRREYLLFVVVNAATLLLNVGAVAFVRYPLGQQSTLVLQAANVAGIGAGTILRYLSYRRWVFPAHESSPPATSTQPAAGSASGHAG